MNFFWNLVTLLKPCLQPYAGLLPPRVLAPGQAMGTVTDHMAKLTGLSKDCVVCAGTSGQVFFYFLFLFRAFFLSSFEDLSFFLSDAVAPPKRLLPSMFILCLSLCVASLLSALVPLPFAGSPSFFTFITAHQHCSCWSPMAIAQNRQHATWSPYHTECRVPQTEYRVQSVQKHRQHIRLQCPKLL